MNQTKPTLLYEMHEPVRRLHPVWQFCRGERSKIHRLNDRLVDYLINILKATPVAPPVVPDEEWALWLDVLKIHYLIAYVYHCLKAIDPNLAPPESVVAEMRQAAMIEKLTAECKRLQLCDILQRLGDAEIPVLILKGPALAYSVYPDPGLRPHSDLDLLVSREFFLDAYRCLESIDYQGLSQRYKSGSHFYYDDPFIPKNKRVGPCNVELHWELSRFPQFKRKEKGIDLLFQRSMTMTASGLSFSTLSPVDALLYRAMNNAFVHDHDLRLIWVLDAALLAEKVSELGQWPVALDRSVQWRCRNALEFTMRMVQIWMLDPKRIDIPDFSTWPKAGEAELKVWKKATLRRQSVINYFGLYIETLGDTIHCLLFLRSFIFPDPSYMRSKYPPANGWRLLTAYCRRWWRWLSVSLG